MNMFLLLQLYILNIHLFVVVLQENYNFLVALEEELLKVLVDGTALNVVYQAGIKYAEKEKSGLVANLTKNFGFATGIEFRESSLVIGPKTTVCARKDMVFNLNVGLSGLTNKEASDKEGKVYALFVGDTVQVNVVSGKINL
jgi:nucleosome binding factor SPN SPT16 subunit